MTTAFIVRPFGVKKSIDFDRVERELLRPAMQRLSIQGSTTLEIIEAGNIRDDMFELLLTRDLVIADISIHNANVFYELGIRHALREKRTFLIRCESGGDDVPFDMLTDRFLLYDKDRPGDALNRLVEAIRDTINTDSLDSPVFRAMPNLLAQDVGRFITVPRDFIEEVEIAEQEARVGDLLLLSEEAKECTWGIEGLRKVGRSLFGLDEMEAAKETWEAIRDRQPRDPEANEALGTIYQKLGDLARSNQALRRVLQQRDLERPRRAEIHALIAHNCLCEWRETWEHLSDAGARRATALRSPLLRDAWEAFEEGFRVDRNHYRSGMNAGAMLSILVSLATEMPEVWNGMSDTPAEAREELDRLRLRLSKLLGGVEISMQAERERLKAENRSDSWLEINWAELKCLTLEDRPERVAYLIRDALAEAKEYHRDATFDRLCIYQGLQLYLVNVSAAITEVVLDGHQTDPERPTRYIVFLGPRRERQVPLTPSATVLLEQRIDAIFDELLDAAEDARVVGISGAGGEAEILFHEVCLRRGHGSQLYLTCANEDDAASAIEAAGPHWVSRYYALLENKKTERQFGSNRGLPTWLRNRPGFDNPMVRNGLRMLFNAMARGGKHASLIVLTEGRHGPGVAEPDHARIVADHGRNRVRHCVELSLREILDRADGVRSPRGGTRSQARQAGKRATRSRRRGPKPDPMLPSRKLDASPLPPTPAPGRDIVPGALALPEVNIQELESEGQ